MAQVGNTGSTQGTTADYRPGLDDVGKSETAERVSAGNLDGENIRYRRKNARNDVLTGQRLRAPKLDNPEDVKPTHLDAAKNEVDDINKLTDKAMNKTLELVKNGEAGTLTADQKNILKGHSKTLLDAADFLKQLSGKNVTGAEGKKAVLAGLGFNQSQMDALLSLADPDDSGNSLASLHGGQAALQGKKDALKAQGFSESQIEALMSLANPDDEGNALMSTHQTGSGSKALLRNLGFSEAQAERLSALLSGKTAGTEDQKNLLKPM